MKKLFYSIASVAMLFGATSCSDNNDEPGNVPGTPQVNDLHFDIFVSIDGAGGMASQSSILVLSVNSLEDPDAKYDFVNAGTDITASLYEESITKGEYYYMVPKSEDCFGKYQITPQGVKTIQERPFTKNTFKSRRYCHAWTGDNTLVIIGSNGDNGSKSDKGEILWTKYDTSGTGLSIIEEGTLGLNGYEGENGPIVYFSTSGLARYRKSDNTIIYAFQDKKDEDGFYVAFIDASTMKYRKIVYTDAAEMMAGTAYGELLQNKMAFDQNENLYIACNSVIDGAASTTCQKGSILRINNGSDEFDKSFNSYSGNQGKIVTIDYIGSNKMLLYIQDPNHCGLGDNTDKSIWGSKYNCYYAILDMTNNNLEPVKYNGSDLPYCLGTFSQRSLVVNNKAYIGVNPEQSAPCIYVMDLNNWNVTKGSTIADGYTFDMIRYLGKDL